ncbi:MAG: hypothetical protein QM778_28665 [Myxococcales bacterium]
MPAPDLANFPNSSITLPHGRAYLETTPLNMSGASSVTPFTYNWEVFVRVGVTDHIEARLYTSGLTVQRGFGVDLVGFSPLTFDTKMHLTQHAWKHFNFSLGLEAYVQTPWGSPRLSEGFPYSVIALVDHDLPWEFTYSWNLGFLRALTLDGDQVFVPTFQAALQRNLIDDLAIFVQSFRNAATLPRSGFTQPFTTGHERGTVFGAGLQWTVNERWALFGSFNVGYGHLVPRLSGSAGVALSM